MGSTCRKGILAPWFMIIFTGAHGYLWHAGHPETNARLTLGRGVGWSGVAGKETISWLDAGGMTVRGGGDAAWSPAVMK